MTNYHDQLCKGMEYLGSDPEMQEMHKAASDYEAVCERLKAQEAYAERMRQKAWDEMREIFGPRHDPDISRRFARSRS